MKFNIRSLRSHLGFWFLLVIGIILILVWLFQVFFIVPYYEKRMKTSLVSTSRLFMIEYESNPSEENFMELSRNAIYENIHIMCAEVLDNGEVRPTRGELIGVDTKILGRDLEEKVLSSIEEEKVFTYTQRGLNDLYIYAVKLNGNSFRDNEYLISSVRVTPISATRMIIQEQLLFITLFSIVIGISFSFFASRRLARPISELQHQASEFTRGNYDVSFKKEGYLEVVELADTLTEAAKQLKATDELRRSITANVSHDLRTPLTIIKSYAEMIRDLSGDKKEKREEHLEIIISETDRLSELVNDVLTLSKLESGVSILEKKIFNLSQTIETCLTKFEIYQMKYGYKIECDIDEDIMVYADEKRINGVLYNLISNALNYTGEDKTIYIHFKKEGKKAVFSVKDTGEGISLENQKRIWEQYYRDEKNHHRSVVGTGLGLSIVKNVLDLHKIKYGVSSVIGKGSTFYFELEVREE